MSQWQLTIRRHASNVRTFADFSLKKGGRMEHDEGWNFFAAVVLGVAGIMRIFDAIWAFRYHGVLPENLEDAIFGHSLKTYGWVYLVVAVILIVSAAAIAS